jgi:uncharacterized phage-like protein YoqJ
MRKQTVCFTGHREIPPEKLYEIRELLRDAILDLIAKGYRFFSAGGALGFDTIAAQTVLSLQKQYPQIRLILVLPYLCQSRSWNAHDKAVFGQIKQQADKVIYISQDYARGCMHKRNRLLVDSSSVCLCYLTKPTGGTAYTVKYAKGQGLLVINIGEDAHNNID